MKSKQSFEDMASSRSREEETDEAPILNEERSGSAAIEDSTFETFNIRTYPLPSKKKYEVIAWIIILALLVCVGYLLYDNKVQEAQIISIIKKIEENTVSHKNNSALESKQLANEDSSALVTNNKSALRTGRVGETSQSMNGEVIDGLSVRQAIYPPSQIPKRTWYYESKTLKASSLWTQKCLQRYKYLSHQLQTELTRVNISNYGRYISAKRFAIVQEIIQNLNTRYQQRLQPQIIRYRELIIKQLIIIEVLVQNGGIFVDENIILTEDLSWIFNIHSNKLVNARQWVSKAEIIAFYSTDLSKRMVKFENISTDLEERYITLLPTIMPYFLAVAKNSQFLFDLRDEYYRLAYFPKQARDTLDELQINMNLKDFNIYKNLFEIASQIVLHRQQKTLQGKTKVIAYYQIAAINQNFGPTKLKSFLSTDQIPKTMKHLSFISREQLQQQFGKLRYLVKVERQEEFYVQLQKRIKGKNITNNSLIHQLMFASSNESFISFVKEPKTNNLRWDSLPSKVWTYLTTKSQEYSLMEQMWLEHTKTLCKQSNFTFTVLNNDNIHQYIPKAVLDRLTQATNPKISKLIIYPSTKMQLLSLAIINQHGGVWIDPLVFISESLDWLRFIGKEKLIWNRNGDLPKVVISFHPHYGSPFDWTYKEQGGKDTWHLSYETGFIAAEPKSELINAWYEDTLTNLGMVVNDLFNKFYLCKIFHDKWSGDRNHQYITYDSLKCVLGAKKVYLSNQGSSMTPNSYYGLWSINGFNGYLKLREYTNFFGGRSMDNPFIWRYSFDFMQEQIGKIHHIVKIYPYSVPAIQKYIGDNLKDLSKEIHADSYIMKILNKINGSVVKRDNHLYLSSEPNKMKNISTEVEDSELLANISKVLWLYLGGQIETNQEFNENMFDNIQQFAQKSSYQVRYVTRDSFHNWLSSQSNYQINQFISELQRRLGKQKSNLEHHIENIFSQMINLHLLYENGGVAIDKRLVLHQDLSWISEIEKQQFMNTRDRVPAKVFAFHSPGYSPKKIKDPKSQVQYIPTPSIQFYFIAAGKRSAFIRDLKHQFQNVVLSHNSVVNQIKGLQYEPGWLRGNDPYYEAFFIASQFVLSQKQQVLKKSNIQHSALEEYGLYTMNSRFFVSKINYFFNSLQISHEKLRQYLGKSSISELESYVGKLRYFSLLPKFDELKDYVTKSSKGQKEYQIVQQSFLHQYLVPKQQQNGVVKYLFSSQKQISWDELPQDVWVYTGQGIQTANIISKVIFFHINASFSSKGYNVHEINDTNIEKFLEKDVLSYWANIIGRQSKQVHKQYIYRLLLLQKYGGISISLNLVPIEDVSWIKRISYLPPQLVFNRFQQAPQVFMFIDPLRSAGTQWHYSDIDKTRVGHELGWNDDFIAVEKDNELINEWLEIMQSILQLQSQKQVKYFEVCEVKANRKSASVLNKLRLDVLQCLLNRRLQRLLKAGIKTEVCKYYRLWSVNEYLGLSKFEDHFDLDERRNDLNPLLWNWPQSQAETLIGKVQLMTRLTDKQLPMVEQLIKQRKDKPWGKQDSLLVKTLYSSAKDRLKVDGDNVVIVL